MNITTPWQDSQLSHLILTPIGLGLAVELIFWKGLVRDTLYPQRLALTSPTIGGCSVGIVHLRTTGHGDFSTNLRRDTDYPTADFHSFPQSLQAIIGLVPR
jgi:hypothetical protein